MEDMVLFAVAGGGGSGGLYGDWGIKTQMKNFWLPTHSRSRSES